MHGVACFPCVRVDMLLGQLSDPDWPYMCINVSMMPSSGLLSHPGCMNRIDASRKGRRPELLMRSIGMSTFTDVSMWMGNFWKTFANASVDRERFKKENAVLRPICIHVHVA